MDSKNKFFDFLNFIKGETVGGVIASVVAMPQALAFGVATGLGAMAGMWGAVILCFMSAVFGPNVPIISGPTGPCTIALAAILSGKGFDLNDIILIILMAALIQLALSLTKLSDVVRYVPYPVISGFLNGVGFILIIMQLNPLLGHNIAASATDTILNINQALSNINYSAFGIGMLTLLICFLIPKRLSRFLPAQLLALIIGTGVSMYFHLDVERITGISLSLPHIQFPSIVLAEVKEYLHYAIILAIVCSSESLLTGLVTDSLIKTKSNTRQILASQGIGNLFCALTGSLPGSAATMRTVAAMKSGASTKVSAIISSLVLLLILLKFGSLAGQIPLAVLAGILIKIGYDIIDTKFLKVIKFAPKDDLYVLMLVFFLTVFYNLIFAVVSGIIFATLLYAKRVADQTNLYIKEVSDKEILKLESRLEKDYNHKIRVVHINGQFFFGSATQIVSQFDDLLGTKYLILNYESDCMLDISAIFALEDIIIRLQSQKIKVIMVIKNEEIHKQLSNLNIIKQIGEDKIFFEEKEAIEHAKKLFKGKIKAKTKLKSNFPFWHFNQ